MATSGEKHVRQRGGSMAAAGENPMAADIQRRGGKNNIPSEVGLHHATSANVT
jgi:hypothetical protein